MRRRLVASPGVHDLLIRADGGPRCRRPKHPGRPRLYRGGWVAWRGRVATLKSRSSVIHRRDRTPAIATTTCGAGYLERGATPKAWKGLGFATGQQVAEWDVVVVRLLRPALPGVPLHTSRPVRSAGRPRLQREHRPFTGSWASHLSTASPPLSWRWAGARACGQGTTWYVM